MFLYLLFENKFMFNVCGRSVFALHLWIIIIFLVQLLLIYLKIMVGSSIRFTIVTVIIIIKSFFWSSLF